MTYRARPVSQRDGSALANSNCRMASIATGLDYQTLGDRTSTGAKMRSYTDDQSGGTDSGDARQSWDRGYGESLMVRDGATFDSALADLRSGRMVHLDIWAATAGGPCLSGSGSYAHSVAVAPESRDGERQFLVADPWCSPASWLWWDTAKLRAGAEQWGGQVYAASSAATDWPTNGPFPSPDVPRTDIRWKIIARVVRELMTTYRPDRPALFPPIGRDTGGGGRILFTVTRDNRSEVPDVAGVQLTMLESLDATAVVNGAGHSWIRVADRHMEGAPDGFTKHVFARAKLAEPFTTPGGTVIAKGTGVVLIGADLAFFLEQDVALTLNGPPGSIPSYDDGWNDASAALADSAESWARETLPPR